MAQNLDTSPDDIVTDESGWSWDGIFNEIADTGSKLGKTVLSTGTDAVQSAIPDFMNMGITEKSEERTNAEQATFAPTGEANDTTNGNMDSRANAQNKGGVIGGDGIPSSYVMIGGGIAALLLVAILLKK